VRVTRARHTPSHHMSGHVAQDAFARGLTPRSRVRSSRRHHRAVRASSSPSSSASSLREVGRDDAAGDDDGVALTRFDGGARASTSDVSEDTDASESRAMRSLRGAVHRRAVLASVVLASGVGDGAWLGERRASASAGPDYALPGPYRVRALPQLEHTCSKCFPMCVGLSCLSRIRVFVPKADVEPDALFPVLGKKTPATTRTSASEALRYASEPPYPVAIITPGFLIDGESYSSIARRLCSWGYVVVMYTKTESVAGGTLDDEVSAAILGDLISWVDSDVTIGPYANPDQVYLIGHSRGGKISMLQALRDERVKAIALLDPVDNTVYAPLGPGFPSALAAMKANPARVPPLLVVGGVYGGECAPSGSNYAEFFAASPRGVAAKGHDAWGFSCGAGHFDFIDEATFVQKVICPDGSMDPSVTRDLCAALVVAHGERVLRPDESSDAETLERTLGSLRSQFTDRGVAFDSVHKLK